METEGSLPYSQVPAICLSWARSIQSMLPHPTSWTSILILSSHLRLGLPICFFLRVFTSKRCTHLTLSHKRCMTQPYSSRFYHLHISEWAVQIIKLLIMKFSPLLWYLGPLRPEYSPQLPIIRHPQPMSLPQRPSSLQSRIYKNSPLTFLLYLPVYMW
jgi:hypothetical protein